MNDDISSCFGGVYRGRRVLVTGHTGFKGAWLCEWLLAMGADVVGFSLPPPTSPSLFEQLQLRSRLRHETGDVRDFTSLARLMDETAPDFVFHLAAQPLVRLSYAQPRETYETNVMGTVNVLDAVRAGGRPCVVLAITTDKCYENREWLHSYREEDALGGHDPYSSSKGAAELVITAYRRSYFSSDASKVKLASARAGNVVGGGDWALDRIVPDCVRSLMQGVAIPVRNKVATRPWQHVLEPLSGYLWLSACLAKPEMAGWASRPGQLASAFNFGPRLESNRSVADLVEHILIHWPGRWEDHTDPNAVHEATLLNLAIDKANHLLRWRPLWNFEQTIAATIEWYRQNAIQAPGSAEFTRGQIGSFVAAARVRKISWSL